MRFNKGLILTEQKKTADAIQIFSSLSEEYPDLPEPYNNLAVLYASQGQYEKAREALEAAIRTHPSYSTAHENLGDIYAKMASQAYGKAFQLDKGNAAAQTKLSLIKDLFANRPRISTASTAGTLTSAANSPVAGEEKSPLKSDKGAGKSRKIHAEKMASVEKPEPGKPAEQGDIRRNTPYFNRLGRGMVRARMCRLTLDFTRTSSAHPAAYQEAHGKKRAASGSSNRNQ